MASTDSRSAKSLHDRLGAIIDQVGHPDYSLMEMVTHIRHVRDDLLALSEKSFMDPDALMRWLDSWWKTDAAGREALRKQFGAEFAPYMRGVADMMEMGQKLFQGAKMTPPAEDVCVDKPRDGDLLWEVELFLRLHQDPRAKALHEKVYLALQSRSTNDQSEVAQDWWDIFAEYKSEGRSDAWLYQQIEAHSQRANARSSTSHPKPVAWRWRWKGGDEPDVWGYMEHEPKNDKMHVEPLYAIPLSASSNVEQKLVDLILKVADDLLATESAVFPAAAAALRAKGKRIYSDVAALSPRVPDSRVPKGGS